MDYRVTGIAYKVHTSCGTLLKEDHYQRKLAHELREDGFRVETEVRVCLTHKAFTHDFFLDLVVDNRVVYELKAVEEITRNHESQLLTYLFLTDTTHGKILNFRPPSLRYRFANTGLSHQTRKPFSLQKESWTDPPGLPLLSALTELLSDWGWGYSRNLYRDALMKNFDSLCVPGEVPLRNGVCEIGTLPISILPGNSALYFSSWRSSLSRQAASLRKLLHMSTLESIHWVNLNQHTIQATVLS